jgi:hypothetical protein
MIISHRLKYVFIHIPKTGGRSIRTLLRNNDEFKVDEVGWWPGISKEQKEGKNISRLFMHSSLINIENYLYESGFNPLDYYFFSFIRNPWDMVVSLYEFYRQYIKPNSKTHNKDILKKIMCARQSFDHFVSNDCHDGKLFSSIIDSSNTKSIDFVGSFENFEMDLKKISNKITNSNQYFPLPHEHKTIREDYRVYYNEETKIKVAKQYNNIISMGNYTF